MKSDTQLLRPLRNARLDKNLIVEFFFVFSRFEYALKRAKFIKPNRRNAEPDWEAFDESIEERYNTHKEPEFAGAVDYLLLRPPKRQIVRDDGFLGWEDLNRQDESEIRWLLLLVRRVRNNLFHGGKYPYAPTRTSS